MINNGANVSHTRFIVGGIDPFLSTESIEAQAKRILETSGPTALAFGAVPDGSFLQRVGAAVLGVNALDPQHNSAPVFDDFLYGGTTSGTIGQLRWTLTVGGLGTVAYKSAANGNPGMLYMQTGATANKGTILSLANGAYIPGAPQSVTLLVGWANQAAANANLTQRFGLTRQPTTSEGDPSSGTFFRAVGAGNWFAVTRDGGVETATDTGVAQSTGFQQFKIVTNAAGNSVAFYIGGVLKATNATNIASNGNDYFMQIENADATDRGTVVDYYYCIQTGLSR